MNNLPKKESQTVEFKTSFNEDVIETLVAFSNAVGGSVYVGIADDGSVKGVSIGKETIANWISEIRNKTAPVIIPNVETLEIDGKIIVIFSVFEYPIKPVSVRGRYYKRVKNANQSLTVTEVVNLHLQSINSSWDACPDALHTLEDISLGKVQTCIEIMREKGMTVTESPLSFLLKLNLLRDDKLTNAAYLLFKNNHSIITTIELGRFQDEITIKDTARTQSDILAQVDEVIDYVKKHINLAVIITGEPRNTQKWQYPMEAIREIVLNMIIHRDYRSSADSIVKIFNDKIEFYNPGKLPDDITIDDLLSNNYRSNPRNKSIADFFKNLGLIEKYGSGIKRIIGYFREENLPLPEFKNISGGFLVTVFSAERTENVIERIQNVPENAENAPEKVVAVPGNAENVPERIGNVPENISEERLMAIIGLMQSNTKISMLELSKILKVNHKTIKRDIEKLKAKGLIERIGPDKGGYWKVK
jgi:ATP-dependent DNA helicase RecG